MSTEAATATTEGQTTTANIGATQQTTQASAGMFSGTTTGAATTAATTTQATGDTTGTTQGTQATTEAAGTAKPWFAEVFDSTGAMNHAALDRAPDNVKKFAEAMKKYKTAEAFFHGSGHTSSMVGMKALAPLPDDAPAEAKEAQLKILREVQKAPPTVDGYKIAKPDNLPEGAQWDEKGMGEYAAIAHKYAIPEAAFEEFKAAQLKSLSGQIASVQVQQQAQLQAEFAALDKSLPAGTTREQYLGEAAKGLALASKLTGIAEEELKASARTAKDVKLFAAFAQIAGEDKLVAAAADTGGVNYDAKITELMNSKEYMHSDEAVRGPVMAEVRRLLTLQSKLKK